MTSARPSDAKVCGHDTERLRDLGWYHCPNCGEYIGDHRGISRGGQHCTDNACRCHGYPLVKRQEHIPSKERLTEIRSSAEVGKANGITAERRYGGDAYADRVWLVTEVDRLQDRCAEFEANLTIAERQVTEARMELDRRSDETNELSRALHTIDEAGKLSDWINLARPVVTDLMQAYERRIRTDCTLEQLAKEPWRCMEYIAAEHLLAAQPVAVVEITAVKAFVHLCAPHGQDWLTCPECAKAAVNGAEPCTK